MKNQITASVVAFALALALPGAAFAAQSITASPVGNEVIINTEDESLAVDGVKVKGDTGDVTYKNYGSSVVSAAYDTYYKAIEALQDQVAKGELTQKQADDKARTLLNKLNIYLDQCNIVSDDNGDNAAIAVFNLTAENADAYGKIEGGATVTVYLDNTYAGKVVTYKIFHADGSIQTKTVKVAADGSVRINVNGFSTFAFYYTPNYKPEAQDGAAGDVSPKTGF